MTLRGLALLSLPATLLLPLGVGCDRTPPATETWSPVDHTHPPDSVPGPGATQVAVEPADDGLTPAQRTARSVYVVACGSCHGAVGRGDGPDRAPVMRLPDFQSPAWQASRTDDELMAIISLGRGMMPAFGDRIPLEGVRALVAHLRSLAPAAAEDATDAEAPVDGGTTSAP